MAAPFDHLFGCSSDDLDTIYRSLRIEDMMLRTFSVFDIIIDIIIHFDVRIVIRAILLL